MPTAGLRSLAFPGVPQAPTGTVTFLFTDIEGSTRLWDEDSDAMRDALSRHDAILREAIGAHGGLVFATGGDGFTVAFAAPATRSPRPSSAQVALTAQELPVCGSASTPARRRSATATISAPRSTGPTRLMAIGHGGQVLVSGATAQLLADVELARPR